MSSLQTVILNIYNIFCKRNSFRNDFNSLCSTSIYLFVLLEIEFFNFGKKLQLLHARVQSVGICPFRGYFIPILFKSADYYYNKLSLSPPMFLTFQRPYIENHHSWQQPSSNFNFYLQLGFIFQCSMELNLYGNSKIEGKTRNLQICTAVFCLVGEKVKTRNKMSNT